MIVVTNPEWAQKMPVCIAARALNSHILIVPITGNAAERRLLPEFGVASVVDAMDERADTLPRAVRQSL